MTNGTSVDEDILSVPALLLKHRFAFPRRAKRKLSDDFKVEDKGAEEACGQTKKWMHDSKKCG